MYGLPKIHEPDVPLRPNPVLDFDLGFGVKESLTFASTIRQLPFCNDSQFLVSFDTVTLFTNFSLDETISICADFLYRRPSITVLPFPEYEIVELMEIATKSVSLSFNDIIYRQTDGISIGSLLGPILTNILVGFHEKQQLEKFPKPYIYLRHVDDTC